MVSLTTLSTLSIFIFKLKYRKANFISKYRKYLYSNSLLQEDQFISNGIYEEKADEDGFSIIAMWNWERKNYFIKE